MAEVMSLRRIGHAADVNSLLRPRSIAIVGATDRQASFGAALLAAIRGGRYAGRVYAVNPRRGEVAGLVAYPSLESLPELPDLVAFAISDEHVAAALAEAASVGVPAAALFGRYHDVAPSGPGTIRRLTDIARASGMVICGGNCMGYINYVDGLQVSGNVPPLPRGHGGVGLVSHSGATWAGLIGNRRGIAFNYAISSGQEIATTMADYMEFMLDQPETRVLALVLETVREPTKFLRAIKRAASMGIPVVALKLGRSSRGREFAATHSGALSGSDEAYAAVFAKANVIRVFTPDEMADTIEMMSCVRKPPAGGIGLVTDSGGERELLVDIAEDIGAPLTEFTAETQEKLAAVLDRGMTPQNPVDCYGDGAVLIGPCMDAIAADPGVGVVCMANNLVSGRAYLGVVSSAVSEVHSRTDKPVALLAHFSGTLDPAEAATLRSRGIPVLAGTSTGLSALRHFTNWHSRRRDAFDFRIGSSLSESQIEALKAAILEQRGATSALPPDLAFELLQAYGLEVPPFQVVSTETELEPAVTKIGFPLAIKTAAADIAHKTEAGGVALEIRSLGGALHSYRTIRDACGPRVIVQRQVGAGIEFLLGMVRDPHFGPMMTLGIGGIFAELVADVVTVVPPVNASEVPDILTRLRWRGLFEGFRGIPAPDCHALALTVHRFSLFCYEFADLFEAIDINPVIARPDGTSAVDILMITRRK